MITILTYEIDSWPSLIRKIVRYIQTPTVVISFIALLWYSTNINNIINNYNIVLCSIVIYYYSTLSGALKEVNKDLRIQLHMVSTLHYSVHMVSTLHYSVHMVSTLHYSAHVCTIISHCQYITF